jgi:hypothetical protein
MYLILGLKLFVTLCNNFCCTSLFKDTSPLNYVICLVPVHKQLIHRLPVSTHMSQVWEGINLWLVSDVRSLDRIRCAERQRFGIQ